MDLTINIEINSAGQTSNPLVILSSSQDLYGIIDTETSSVDDPRKEWLELIHI